MNSGGKVGKFTKIWKLNGTLLNNQWARKEITREIKIPLVKEKQKHTKTYAATKVELRGKFITVNAYIKKKISSQYLNCTP